jgi:hypothetical protein
MSLEQQNLLSANQVLARAFDDSWRTWIAQNILLGAAPDELLRLLITNGFDGAVASKEIALAQASPYMQAASQLGNRLAKHDWVLEIHRKLDKMLPQWGSIERRHQLSRTDFFNQYYATNRPVIITGMMENWPALQKWSPVYFKAQYGERIVEVQNKRNSNQRYEVEQAQHKHKMSMADYVDAITSIDETNDMYLTANNSSHNANALRELWNDVVQIPEYLDGNSLQRGFLWFGPKGTITPLHHDLTNNFMAQVFGKKCVKLVQSNELPYVYNNLHCYSEVDLGNIDYERYPLMHQVNIINCELNPGEILFLPVGCWHYVQGLEISITISFTNFVFDNDFHSMYKTYHAV